MIKKKKSRENNGIIHTVPFYSRASNVLRPR